MRYFLSISLCLTALLSFGQQYEAPVLSCLAVTDGGGMVNQEITMFWTPPADPLGDFLRYEVYHFQQQSGEETMVATYGAIGQILHVGPDALLDNQSRRYFVAAIYSAPAGGEVFASSDTLGTMRLSQVITGNQGTVGLDWNSPYPDIDTLPDSLRPEGQYYIEMFHEGIWQLLDSTDFGTETFTYVISVCHGLVPDIPLSFRVRVETEAFCSMISTVKGGNFKDENPPTSPLIETVTVDTTTNKAVICWYPSPELDTGGYIVQTDNQITVEDNIVGRENTEYQNPLSLASVFVEGYLVLAQDTCLHQVGSQVLPNQSSAIESVPHFTILPRLDFLKCEKSVEVTWNPYESWPLGVERYEIYGAPLGSPLQLLDSVSAAAERYVHEDVMINDSLIYMVKAIPVDDRKPSLSAKIGVFTNYPLVPSNTYLSNVSVLEDDLVEVTALIDTLALGSTFEFQKLDRFGEVFETFVALPPVTVLSSREVSVLDIEAIAGDGIQSYRMLSLDSCGFEYAVSDTSYNMFLQVYVDDNERTNTLTWQRYRQWAGVVGEYHVYRTIDGEFTPFPYAVVDGSRNYFEDRLDTQEDYNRSSTVCYYVEAIEVGNPFGVDQVSRSNEACGIQEPLMFVPNAIVVNGVNRVFAPVGGYFDRTDYRMEIYDRSGERMYVSTDFEVGWDATDGSGYVQEGIYIYVITYGNGAGKQFEKRGYLSVLVLNDNE